LFARWTGRPGPWTGWGRRAYLGAQPVVDPADGTLFLAAKRIAVSDPTCTFTQPVTRSQVLFTSHDGGVTFGPAVTVAAVTAATPTGALELGPGLDIRTIEFPALAVHGSTLWLAWNDGSSGRSHLRLATSSDRGASWVHSSVTRGSGDEIQPSLANDARGLHIAFYRRNADNSLDTAVADSSDSGVHFTSHVVTSRPSPACGPCRHSTRRWGSPTWVTTSRW
jgi:hypothetical protein